MPLRLPPVISAYLQAADAFDIDALAACFSPDAVVVDEGHTHRGLTEIRRWFEGTRDYNVTLEPTGVDVAGGETIVTCRVTGTFPGSPIDLRFFFTVEKDRIEALTIQP